MTNIPLEPLANLVLWEYSRVFDNLKTSWKQLPRDRKDHPLATVQNSSHSPVANQGGVTTQGKPWGSLQGETWGIVAIRKRAQVRQRLRE